jgi:hypothetical protein
LNTKLNQMKKQLLKAGLVAALGLGASTAAQAQINNDDLVLGFTSPNATSIGGVKSDYIIDLGQVLGTSPAQIPLSGSQYNDPTFTANLGGAVTGGSAYVGIFGAKSGSSGDVILSSTVVPPTGSKSSYASAATFPASVTLGLVPQTGQSVFNNISTAPGQPGNNATSFGLYVPSPLETISSSQGTGQSLLNLEVYRATYPLIGNASAFVDQGFISLLFSANGGIAGVAWNEPATSAVPEPSTYGLFAGAGLLLVLFRRQLTGRTA